MKHLILLLITAAALLAADATGKWSGTMTVTGPDGQTRPGPAYLVLKQEGMTVSGTAGPSANEQNAIQNGKVENGKVTFEIPLGPAVMKFALQQTDDAMDGDVSAEAEGQKMTAKIAVKREK